MKLLIVDDSLVVRNAVERSARARDITEIFQAANGMMALEIYRILNPELVTMDLTMPEIDGLDCIRQIREINPYACILVISAINSHETAMAAIEAGACGFVTKPFTQTELEEALEDLIQHAKETSYV